MADWRNHLHLHRLWLVLGWLLLIAIIVVTLIPDVPGGDMIRGKDKVAHFLAYFILMGWFVQIFHQQQIRIYLAIGFFCMGVGLEILQGLGGVRYFEYADMAANGLGVLIAWLLSNTSFQRILIWFERSVLKLDRPSEL